MQKLPAPAHVPAAAAYKTAVCVFLQDVEAVAGVIFQLYQQRITSADASALTSIISSCKDLKLYSKTLLSAVLARAKTLLQQQLQGFSGDEEGFSGRQLGVLMHSLAVLGLKPGDAWLRLAVVVAGKIDLHRVSLRPS